MPSFPGVTAQGRAAPIECHGYCLLLHLKSLCTFPPNAKKFTLEMPRHCAHYSAAMSLKSKSITCSKANT